MIAILAPTAIRARHYAAALGLTDAQWRHTTAAHVRPSDASVHLLPGADEGAIHEHVYDLRQVT